MSRGGDELTTRPNVLFTDRDNADSGAIDCYAGAARTPRINVLATEGTRFKNYSVETKCTQTLSALLTGRLLTAPWKASRRC